MKPTAPMPDAEPRADARTVLLIAVGGALGTVARYELGLAVPVRPGTFPITTLLINVVGALLLGALLGTLGRTAPNDRIMRPLLGVGFLGGFTTFSTFAVETVQLVRRQHVAVAAAYVIASIAFGLAAARAGERLVRATPRLIREDET